MVKFVITLGTENIKFILPVTMEPLSVFSTKVKGITYRRTQTDKITGRDRDTQNIFFDLTERYCKRLKILKRLPKMFNF